MVHNPIKSLSVLVLAVLMASSNINLNSTSAIASDSDDEFWTARELLDFTPILREEVNERCGGKTNEEWTECWWGLQDEWRGRNGIYEATRIFNEQTFVITAINPSEESIRVVFHDEDAIERQMFGTENHYPVVESYIVWLDPEYDQSISYLRHLRNQESAPGMHVIFDSHDTGLESNWWPADEEITITAKDQDISQNTSGSPLHFWVANYPSSVLGQANYTAQCLNSEAYQSGMECQIVYNAQGQFRYLPVETKREIVTSIPATTEPTLESGPAQNPESKSASSPHSENSPQTEPSFGPGSQNIKTTNVTTPNTGEATMDQNDSVEFPWWLGAIFASGIAVLIWLFWPQRQKTSKKS